MNPNLPIRQLMTTKLVTVQAGEKIKHIQSLFDTNNFHHLLVVNHQNELTGIISKEDFYKFTYTLTLNTTGRTWSNFQYSSYTAGDIMTESPFVLDPEDTIGLAADIFMANLSHALPVVEDGELIGILTTHDLLKYCFRSSLEQPVDGEFTEADFAS